jgi:8-oxo-dGTP pyrophosphatase MutT (NUDIX family)
MSSKTRLSPWRRLDSERVYSTRVFEVTRNRTRSPRTGEDHDFFVLESGDWVNIIPVTPEREVVLIWQYRHGIDEFTLEVPGGMVDATDPSPLFAARREMQEETGYDSEDVIPLGAIHPNPALQRNRCHSFLARDVELVGAPRFDGTEETEVALVPLADIPTLIREGRISHALVVVAFHWLALHDHALR